MRPAGFIRGGQTAQHWARMLVQVIRYGLWGAALTYVIAFCVLLYLSPINLQGIGQTYAWRWSEYLVISRGDEMRDVRHRDAAGRFINRPAIEVYQDPQFQHIYASYRWMTLGFARWALIPTGAVFVLLAFAFLRLGKNIRSENFVRGAKLISQKELKDWSLRKWKAWHKEFPGAKDKNAPRYSVGGVPFPPNAVEAQTALFGTVGTGKTNAMHELLHTIEDHGGRAIIYDRMGTLVRDHYDPQRDIIINPFDGRAHCWSPFFEAFDVSAFAHIAEVMIPDSAGANNDKFWAQASRLVFEYAARKLFDKHGSAVTNAMLREAILAIPNEELELLLKRTPGGHFFGEHVGKTSGSIRANMITALRFLEFLRDDGEPFSIRTWVKEHEGPGFVFLTGDAEHGAVTRNVISTVLEVAATALMTCAPSRDPKIWFFMDEAPTLNRLPFLPKSLAEIRQFGGAFVVGWQVYSQMVDLYGRDGAETISGTLNNRFIFNTPDFETARRASQSLGEEDVEEALENMSFGANVTRDGVSIARKRTQRPIVTAGQIQTLEQFKCFAKMAYDTPAALLVFKPVPARRDAQPSFVKYSGDFFGKGTLDLTDIIQTRRERGLFVSRFEGLPAQQQCAEFKDWLARYPAYDDRAAALLQPDGVLEYLWAHFSRCRQKGDKPQDIPMAPSLEAAVASNSVPPRTLPYPTERISDPQRPEGAAKAPERARQDVQIEQGSTDRSLDQLLTHIDHHTRRPLQNRTPTTPGQLQGAEKPVRSWLT